nr:alpha/beta fold hydrolase [Streptomyces vinaceus]
MPVTTTHHVQRIATNGVQLNVAIAGEGPAVLLLHGFPHTWQLWSDIMGRLAGQFRVIAPDLRGFGASDRPVEGYDAGTLAADVEGLLDAVGEPSAAVVGIDAGAAPAVLLALRRPGLVRRLVVMEALLGRLPGAEDVFAGGAPWWFGFHAVPGLRRDRPGRQRGAVRRLVPRLGNARARSTRRHPRVFRARVHRG